MRGIIRYLEFEMLRVVLSLNADVLLKPSFGISS